MDKTNMEMQKIGERMQSQDNRITADPIFIVQQRRRIHGLDIAYADKTLWLYEGREVAKNRADLDAFLGENGLHEKDSVTDGLLEETGYQDIWEFVQPFFSQKGADDYIRMNHHNLADPQVYVESAHRNTEWQTVRKFLLDDGGKSQDDQ